MYVKSERITEWTLIRSQPILISSVFKMDTSGFTMKLFIMSFYYIPINDTSFELSVVWPSDIEGRINELRFSDYVSLSFKTRLTSVTCFYGKQKTERNGKRSCNCLGLKTKTSYEIRKMPEKRI